MKPEELKRQYGDQLQHCDTSFDSYFDCMIEFGHMTWKPWIGADWKASPRRILVVGESHYASKQDEDKAQEKIGEWQADPDSTREVIYEAGIGDWYYLRFFGNLHRALLGKDVHGGARVSLWRHLAFCNFIQRPMKNPSDRPSPDEFFGGWRHFMELLRRLRPDAVLFVGVSAARHFDAAAKALGVEHKVQFDAYRNGAFPCTFSATYDGMTTNMVAIRHASQFFSWEIWRDYLREKMPEGMDFLRDVVSDADSAASSAQAPAPPSEPAEPPKGPGDAPATLAGLPTWLSHKPVLACDYQEVNEAAGCFDSDDARFISVGHAQYNPNEASVKMFRWSSDRWSRQSEEVPVQRLPYMMAMLLAAIFRVQHPGEAVPGDLGDVVVAPQDMDLLREQLQHCAAPLQDGLFRVKALLDRIHLDALLKDEAQMSDQEYEDTHEYTEDNID